MDIFETIILTLASICTILLATGLHVILNELVDIKNKLSNLEK